MRKLCILLALMLFVLPFAGCGDNSATTGSSYDVTTTENPKDDISPEPEKKISTVEEMAELEGVERVVKNEEYSVKGSLVYDITFNFDGVIIEAQMALPEDYGTKNCATVLYFPDVKLLYQYLTEVYAENGIIIIRFGYRTNSDAKQKRDYCGEDYNDVKSFFEICKKCDFLTRGGITAIGSSEGALRALKLAVDYPDDIMGCAVIDVTGDIESLIEFRGEGIKELFEYFIGGSVSEKPEEYKKRSPVYFADKISVPVLIFAYNNSPLIPLEQATMLKDAILDGGGSCEFNVIYSLSSDFMTEDSFVRILEWVAELQKSNGYASLQ